MGMTDIQETIQGLYALKTYLASKAIEEAIEENGPARESLIGMQKVVDSAVNLLKEQEAVEARKKNDGKPQPWTSWWYVCGDCGQEIEYHDRFCRWCGRSVKWK